MDLKKIEASSLAEVVIALAIISLSFAMVARIFTQGSGSTIMFNEVKEQTEIQGIVMEGLINDTLPNLKNWKEKTYSTSQTKDKLTGIVLFRLMSSEKLLFDQEFIKIEDEPL